MEPCESLGDHHPLHHHEAALHVANVVSNTNTVSELCVLQPRDIE